MRDFKVLSDHQRSSGEEAKDSVALRGSLFSTDIVHGVNGHPLPIGDLGDAVGDGDLRLRRCLLHSLSIDHLTEAMTADYDCR